MRKIKTSELTDRALAWAVGLAEKRELSLYGVDPSIRARVPGLGVDAPWNPTKYWNQGGPIIEREGVDLNFSNYEGTSREVWDAACEVGRVFGGPTPLIAAMRCYVASKLGDEVEIPQELT
jgi:hypothetical protein